MTKKIIKFFVSHLLRNIHRDKITVFMAHGVVDPNISSAWRPLRNITTVSQLDNGIDVLKRYYKFISMDEAYDVISGKSPSVKNGAVLTFDDGYLNNFTNVLPVLTKHGVPAVFYIPTGFVGNGQLFWYDRLDYAIQSLVNGVTVRYSGVEYFFNPVETELSRVTFSKLREAVKIDKRSYLASMKEILEIIQFLEKESGKSLIGLSKDDQYSTVMNWDQIVNLSNSGMTIGSHTVDHLLLDRLEEDEIYYQLFESKKIIEKHVNRECKHFCYPNGNFDTRVVKNVRNTGYSTAVTTEDGLIAKEDDCLMLRRINFSNTADPFDLLWRARGKFY